MSSSNGIIVPNIWKQICHVWNHQPAQLVNISYLDIKPPFRVKPIEPPFYFWVNINPIGFMLDILKQWISLYPSPQKLAIFWSSGPSRASFFSAAIEWNHHFLGFSHGKSSKLPSGKRLHNYGKIHHFSWDNQLFLWPCSIVFCMFTRR